MKPVLIGIKDRVVDGFELQIMDFQLWDRPDARWDGRIDLRSICM